MSSPITYKGVEEGGLRRPVTAHFSSKECYDKWKDGTIDSNLGFNLENENSIMMFWFDDKEDMETWFRGNRKI